MTAASSRKAVNTQAKECMTALYKMKASMTCMSCDPTNEKALQSDFDVTSSGYTNDFMTKCATYLSIYKDYKSMVTTVVTYASTVTTSTALSTAMTNLNAITSAQTGWVDACMSTTPAKTTPATPAKTTPATPAKTEAKKRVLQAVVPTKPAGPSVEHDDWNWWVKQNVARSVSVKASAECLASSGITDLINNWVFNNKNAEFNYFVVYYKALDAAYKAVGNATAIKKWKSFIGTKLIAGSGSSKTDKKADTKTTPATPAKKDDKKADTKTDNSSIEGGFLPPLKTLNVLASAFAPKDSKKKVATGGASSRRAQAVVPKDGKAVIKISATGVDLNTSKNTYATATDSNFSGDGQGELSGNLLKFASALVLSLVLLY